MKLGEKALKSSRHCSYRSSHENLAHGEIQARYLLTQGIQKAGLTTEMLLVLPGSDPRKVLIARSIKEETTVSLQWIAEHLAMKSAATVSQQLHRHRAKP